jgi:hypothetical protein
MTGIAHATAADRPILEIRKATPSLKREWPVIAKAESRGESREQIATIYAITAFDLC